MPCVYIETPDEIRAQKKQENAKIIAPWKAKLNNVTELLCFVMTSLHDASSLDDFDYTLTSNKKLQAWWKEHQAADSKLKENWNTALDKLIATAPSESAKQKLRQAKL